MTIWKNLRSVEELNSGRAGTLDERLGIEFTEISDDCIRATMPVDARTRQPYGLLHGGASVALAETLGSTGATMCVDHTKFRCVGQEINANHLRPARSGYVTGTARPVHLGARSQVWTIEIVNEAGNLVCTSRLTIAIIRRTPSGASN
ncbi:MAG TPA: hotdog fold thioesterase [Steroidobacteraceae bacterium]|jgi:1,4-dihydroxy-2-naphthoyl-CoA hydrolase|nr:hotdog fold thioesterase [Steroidobacteraceae bacterium]